MHLAVFTICSNPQLAQAAILLASVERHLPAARRVLILADEVVDGLPYPGGCEIVPAHALGIPDFRNLAFRYAPHEFRAALKPFACQFLLSAGGHTHCLFFAPDTELFGPLAPVMAALETDASFILVPHLLAPAEGADGPDDVTFLRDGTYDLGFLGVSGVPEAHRLLSWWTRWLRWECVDDRPTGFFVDQKFMDLMPGFAAGLAILRDPALNVAPWNLAQRGFSAELPEAPQVDGRPLGFFRFGDTDPAAANGPVAGFLAGYAGRVQAAGGDAIPAGCYAYARFASGVPIPAIVRRMFHDDNPAWAGDPFEGYEGWSHLPARNAAVAIGSAVPSLAMQWLQARNPALARLYPTHPAGAAALLRWWLEQGGSAGIDPRFLQPQALAAGRRPVRLRSACPAPQPGRADASVVAAFARPGVVRQAGLASLASLAGACRTVERIEAAGSAAITGRLVLVCAEPHQLRDTLRALDGRLPQSCYRVFLPASEVAELPPDFRIALDGVDEVWAPTRCLQSALVLQAEIPVLHMPLAWDFPAAPDRPLVAPETPYVLAEPDGFAGCGELLACLDAFRTAFRGWPAATRPLLVVPRQEGDGELADAVARTEGATTVPATAGLAAHAACVLALHRGEALGRSVARALAYGVPVIGTDCGGSTDLLTPGTGYPVGAADLPGAAWSLRQVFRNPAEAKRRAARGRQRFEAECGRPAVAARQLARLDALGLRRAAAELVHA